jgi:phosphohistidine swiveling domain-containing protein
MAVDWQLIFEAKVPVLFQWNIFAGEKKKYFKKVLDLDICFENGKYIDGKIFYDNNEFAKFAKFFSQKIDEDQNFIGKYIEQYSQKTTQLVVASEEIGKNHQDLLSGYRKYQNAIFETMPFMSTPIIFDRYLEKNIDKLLKEAVGIETKDERETIIGQLIIPKKESFFVQKNKRLVKLAVKRSKGKNIDTEIKKFVKDFGWMGSNFYLGGFLTRKNIEKEITQIMKEGPEDKLVKIRQTTKKKEEKYNQALNKIKEHKKLVKVVKYAQELIYLQTYKMDVLFIGHYHVYPLLKSIAEKFNYPIDNLFYLTGNEILGGLKNNQVHEKSEINQRKEKFALIKKGSKIQLLSGNNTPSDEEKKEDQIKITGTIANQGRATGKAKIVKGVKDIGKVNWGDILISPMTDPKLITAISKSAGIITNLGGMLCHAAIVSREMGIPCIVGTGKATKVFEDGDNVELNAYQGIARKVD